jgi:hypothetical protein
MSEAWSIGDWLAGKQKSGGSAVPPPLPLHTPTSADQERVWKYIDGITNNQAALIKGSRNDNQNAGGYKAFRLALGVGIPLDQVENAIYAANVANGQVADDGEYQVRRTISSARKAAEADGPDYLEERETVAPAFVLEAIDAAADDGSPEMPGGTAELDDYFEREIRRRAIDMRLSEKARGLAGAWTASELGQTAPEPVGLKEFLAVPDEDAVYRITDLLPVGGRALLAAQQKAGKTSMVANLIRTLADGGSFLDAFPVEPVERLTLIDNELDERMLRRWLRDQGIVNTDRVQIISLKGKISTFDIQNDASRAQWATKLRGSQFIILDCLRPCLDALGLSEDKDAGKFLVAWDALMLEAGADESVVVHHMGHSQERSRGDSRLQDWPDVNWKIVKDSQNADADPAEIASDGGLRWFSAHGRDVNVAEGQLDWIPATRTIRYLAGGRAQKKARAGVDALIELLGKESNGLTTRKVYERMQLDYDISEYTARKAVKTAKSEGAIYEEDGSQNSKILHLSSSYKGLPDD